MKEQAIDVNSAPDTISLRSQDFLCSPAFQCAPLGGLNEFSVDYSAVINMPLGPDGESMSGLWGEPSKIPVYLQQGYQLVPSRCFRGDWNGGKQKKLVGASPSIDFKSDDIVYKEGRQQVFLWTSATNKRRLERNNDAAAERSRSGGGKFASVTEGEDSSIFAGTRSSAYTEQSFTTIGGGQALTMAGPVSKK